MPASGSIDPGDAELLRVPDDRHQRCGNGYSTHLDDDNVIAPVDIGAKFAGR